MPMCMKISSLIGKYIPFIYFVLCAINSYKGLKTAVTVKYKIGENAPTILNTEQFGNEIPPQPDTDPYVVSRSKPDALSPDVDGEIPNFDVTNSAAPIERSSEYSKSSVHRAGNKVPVNCSCW